MWEESEMIIGLLSSQNSDRQVNDWQTKRTVFYPFHLKTDCEKLLSQKTGGDEDGTVATYPPEGWVAIPGAVIVREKHEKKSNTRDEIDERLETEEVHHLGHLTNQVLFLQTDPYFSLSYF